MKIGQLVRDDGPQTHLAKAGTPTMGGALILVSITVTTLLWGDLARQNPITHAHAFRVLKHDLEWTLVHEAGDLPHDERSDEVNAALLSFLERTRRWTGSVSQRLAMA